MSDEEKEGVPKVEDTGIYTVPAQEVPKAPVEVPLTKGEFVEELNKLVARARAAGVRPLQEMALSYMKNMAETLESLFASLDEGNEKNRKKKPRD